MYLVTNSIFNAFRRGQNPLEYEALLSMYFLISCKNLHNELSISFMNMMFVCVYKPRTHAQCPVLSGVHRSQATVTSQWKKPVVSEMMA